MGFHHDVGKCMPLHTGLGVGKSHKGVTKSAAKFTVKAAPKQSFAQATQPMHK